MLVAASIAESVATILERHSVGTIAEWLRRVNQSETLTRVTLSDDARTRHLPALFLELVERLRTPRVEEGTAKISPAASAHGKVRRQQDYTATMLVDESRLLQVCIFKTLHANVSELDFALVLTDVMTIADEVDSQLKQSMTSFQGQPAQRKAVAQ